MTKGEIMKKLTVGQFTDSLFPIIDGVGYVAQNYSYWINEKYGTAYVIGPEAPKYVETDPQIIRFPTIPIPGFAPYRCGVPQLGEFRRRLDAIDFDIVHVQSPFISASEAKRVAKRTGVPIVATFQSKYRDDFSRMFNSKMIVNGAIKNIVRFYNKVDEVWSPNEGTAATLHEYGYEKDVKIIPNGTDMRPLTDTERTERRAVIRRKHHLKDDDFVLMYVGQHRFEKNLKLVIDSLHSLGQKGCDVRAIFIGTGPDEQELKELVQSYNLDRKVIFAGVVKDRNLLQSYFSCADSLVFPSLYDMSSLTMKEAASCSVPTIVVEGSTTSDGIIDEKNGFLIQNNIESLVSKVMYMHQNRQMVKSAGQGALQSVYLSWDTIVDDVYKGYIDLIERKTGKTCSK